jgi:DNA-binding transcriptional LysR family regulator
MDRIAEAELFVAVVDAGGFAAAARRLGRSQPAVSRGLAALEARLGVRLLARSTRAVRMTATGEAFYRRCRQAVALLAEGEIEAADAGASVRGRLRVSAPPTYARARMAHVVAAMAERYPEVTLEMVLSERYVDLVAEDFDVAVRLGPVAPSSLAARVIARERYVLCAAPAYLKRNAAPGSVADIPLHRALVLSSGERTRGHWSFRVGGRSVEVEATPWLRTNDAGLLREAALSGAGITVLPSYLVAGDLAAATLVELLPAARMPRLDVVALHASRRGVPRRVSVFLDLMRAGRRGAAE